MTWTIKLKRGTATEWTSGNPTLENGEPGYETDTGKIKYGDGSTAWISLPYFTVSGAGGGSYTDTSVDTHLNQSSASTGQVLSWNGTDYSWVAQSGGGGGGSSSTRAVLSLSTTSVAAGGTQNLNVSLPSTYALFGVSVSNPSSTSAWMTLYTSNSALGADSSRLITSDPNPNSGVVAEIIHNPSGSPSSSAIEFSPAVLGYKSTGTNNTIMKVKNIGSSSATIAFSISYLQLEA